MLSSRLFVILVSVGKEKLTLGKYSNTFLFTLNDFRAGEVKILDYQSQQHRLFPQLARSFAFLFAGYATRQVYARVLKDIQNRQVSFK